MLQDGSPRDAAYGDSSPLFDGGKSDWIFSITTISTPHLGASLVDLVFDVDIDRPLQMFVVGLSSFLNLFGSWGSDLYDLKMEQWGIEQRKIDESLLEYATKAYNLGIFDQHWHDMALYDLSLEGSEEFNEWATLNGNIYYFSYASSDSRESWTFSWSSFSWKRIHVPNTLTMTTFMQMLSYMAGSRFTADDCGLGDTWLENDGAANTISTIGPASSTDPVVPFDGQVRPNVWNYMGT